MAGGRFERLWPHLHTFHFHERGKDEHYEAYKYFYLTLTLGHIIQ